MEHQTEQSQPQYGLDFNKVSECLRPLLDDWQALENTNAERRRRLRRDEVDVEQLRSEGKLSPDETYIPQRIIDKRIKEEIPVQLSFLQSPERILIFTNLKDSSKSTENLERAFTQFMRYPGWTVPWIRAFDAVNLHGGCGLEVKFDLSKPLHCSIEYIRREDLIFPRDATSLQSCEYIMRRYCYMPFELESFVEKYAFDEEAVKQLVGNKQGKLRHEKIDIYKVYTKQQDGIVYIFWYSPQCPKYIKPPEPLKLGIYDVEEAYAFSKAVASLENGLTDNLMTPAVPQQLLVTSYPVFWLNYELIEDDKLLSSRGRAFRDVADQEVQTYLWSSIVNAAIKAGKIYASYINDPVHPEGLSDEEVIEGNKIYPRELKYFTPSFPSGDLLSVATQQSVQSSVLNSRVDFAVNNRRDSRKTAREVAAAQEQQSMMSGAVIAGQSPVFLAVYELCWKIGQSQVLVGAVTDFPVPLEEVKESYRLAAAGDTDIIVRETKRQIIRETFQYFAGTPIASLLLSYLIEVYFPEKANDWIPILQAGDPTQLLAQASNLLKAAGESNQNITPEQKLQLQQFINLLDQYVQSRQGGTAYPAPRMVEESTYTAPNNLPKAQAGAASGASY